MGTINGTNNNDTLFGTSTDDKIYGENGADTFYSSAGRDRYYLGSNDGDMDVVVFTDPAHAPSNAWDYISHFEKGIDKIDFSALGATSFSDLTISLSGDGTDSYVSYDGLKIKIHEVNNLDANDFIFDGSSPPPPPPVPDDVIAGTDGDDRLYGTDGSDIFASSLGRDRYYLGSNDGAMDTVIFTDPAHAPSNSWDYISHFEKGIDKIDLSALGATSFSDLAISLSGDGTDSYVSYDGLKVKIHEVNNLDAGDFIFDGSSPPPPPAPTYNILEGTDSNNYFYRTVLYINSDHENDWIRGYGGDDHIWGWAGDDLLEGGDGNDILYGGRGADILDGGSGADTYSFRNLVDAGDTILGFDSNADIIGLSLLFKYAPGLTDENAITDGFIRLEQAGADTHLYVDVKRGDGEVLLATLIDTQASDIDLNNFRLPEKGLGGDDTAPIDLSALTAVNDTFETQENVSINFDVLINDTLPELPEGYYYYDPYYDYRDPIPDIVEQAAHGRVSYGLLFYGDSDDYIRSTYEDLLYTPDEGFIGTDSFTYAYNVYRDTSAGTGNEAREVVATRFATVNITVHDDDANVVFTPIAQRDTLKFEDIPKDSDVFIETSYNVLDNDIYNGDRSTLTVSSDSHLINADGSLNLDFGDLTDSNTYYMWDGVLYTVTDQDGNSSHHVFEYEIELVDGDDSDTLPDDAIVGTEGNDSLRGDAGDNYLAGLGGDDVLKGLEGNDILYGGAGEDILWGNDGDDVLYGGGGLYEQDWMKGGFGADTYLFLSESYSSNTSTGPSNTDQIIEFTPAEGDVLDISDIITSYDPLTDDIANFIKVFSPDTHPGDTVIAVNHDGDVGTSGPFYSNIAILEGITLTDDVAQLVADGTIVI